MTKGRLKNVAFTHSQLILPETIQNDKEKYFAVLNKLSTLVTSEYIHPQYRQRDYFLHQNDRQNHVLGKLRWCPLHWQNKKVRFSQKRLKLS